MHFLLRTFTLMIAVMLVVFMVACGDDDDDDNNNDNDNDDDTQIDNLEGKITFEASNDIWVMNADGTNQINLTEDLEEDLGHPSWSPDGKKIAFEDSGHIWVMNADGTNQINLTEDLEEERCPESPAWSPDGKKIAFIYDHNFSVMNADGTNHQITDTSIGDGERLSWSPDGKKIAFDDDDIEIMNADGTNRVQITDVEDGRGYASDPAWSPDGKKIAFHKFIEEGVRDGIRIIHHDIWVMNADGTNEINLTNNSQGDELSGYPSWSPDGKKIAFSHYSEERGRHSNIWVMNADGTNRVQITDTPDGIRTPDWSPK